MGGLPKLRRGMEGAEGKRKERRPDIVCVQFVNRDECFRHVSNAGKPCQNISTIRNKATARKLLEEEKAKEGRARKKKLGGQNEVRLQLQEGVWNNGWGGSYENFVVRRKERCPHRSFLRDCQRASEATETTVVYHYRLKYNNNHNAKTRA